MSRLRPGGDGKTGRGLGEPVGALSLKSEVADTVRLDPVNDAHRPAALVECRVGGLVRYVAESGFHVAVEGAVLA